MTTIITSAISFLHDAEADIKAALHLETNQIYTDVLKQLLSDIENLIVSKHIDLEEILNQENTYGD